MTKGLPDPRIPAGPLADAWRRTREGLPLISPLRKGQMDVLVVGTGLAGASACLLYTSPSPRDPKTSRMPSSA